MSDQRIADFIEANNAWEQHIAVQKAKFIDDYIEQKKEKRFMPILLDRTSMLYDIKKQVSNTSCFQCRKLLNFPGHRGFCSPYCNDAFFATYDSRKSHWADPTIRQIDVEKK